MNIAEIVKAIAENAGEALKATLGEKAVVVIPVVVINSAPVLYAPTDRHESEVTTEVETDLERSGARKET